ncbi:unnamed protein product, partial [Ectocarpus sp. 12 AP-2014]
PLTPWGGPLLVVAGAVAVLVALIGRPVVPTILPSSLARSPALGRARSLSAEGVEVNAATLGLCWLLSCCGDRRRGRCCGVFLLPALLVLVLARPRDGGALILTRYDWRLSSQ